MRSHVKFSAQVEPGTDLVRSPVTDQPCVYWRLRIVERLTVGSELVHEMASSQSFRLLWGARDGGTAPVRILIEPDSARIEATPTLHRHGSPGALAVARAFGFPGALSVEETTILPGETDTPIIPRVILPVRSCGSRLRTTLIGTAKPMPILPDWRESA